MAADHQGENADLNRRYGLYILRLVILRFGRAEPPITARQIADELKLPLARVDRLIENLVEGGLVSAVQGKKSNGPSMYQPACDIHTITIASALEAIDRQGKQNHVVTRDDPEFVSVCRAMDEIQSELRQSPKNKLVKDI